MFLKKRYNAPEFSSNYNFLSQVHMYIAWGYMETFSMRTRYSIRNSSSPFNYLFVVTSVESVDWKIVWKYSGTITFEFHFYKTSMPFNEKMQLKILKIIGSYYPKMIYLWFIGGSTKFNITQVLEFENSRNVSTLNVSIEISKYKLKYKYSIK